MAENNSQLRGLRLPDDKKIRKEREISLGQAAADLVQLGEEAIPRFKMKDRWALFERPAGSPPLTNEILDEWETAEYEEEFRRAIGHVRHRSA